MPEDVNPADPSAAVAPEAALAAGSEPAPVSAGAGDDRPVQNVVAEMNRKFSKLQSQYETLLQYVSTNLQRPAAAPDRQAEPTDDELWSLAQQGDRTAFEAYMRRIADRSGQTQVRAMEAQRLVDMQLQTLLARYPVLADASHPLTQQVSLTYQALVSRGYAADRGTTLEAMKTAIADRPDLVAELQARAAPAAPLRRDRAQAGMTATTVREGPAPESTKALSPAEIELARRMGVRDPAKAKERHQQRQDAGRSSFGSVAAFVREE